MECADADTRSSGKDQRCWSTKRKVESCGCAAARRGSRPGVPRTTPATTTATDEPLSPLRGLARLTLSTLTSSGASSCLHAYPHTRSLLLVMASAFWGVGTVLSKLALDQGDPARHAACRRDGRQQHVPSSRPSCHDQVPSEDRTDGRPGSAGRPRCAEPGPRLCARAVRPGDGQREPGRPGLGDRTSHRRPARRAAALRTP